MRKFLFPLSITSAVVLLAVLALPTSRAHAQVTTSSILNLVNAERAKAGLSPVAVNAKLAEAAQMKASDMLARGYFDHVTPDGKDPWSLYAEVGYDWSWAGEILAMNQNTESDTAIVEAWMNSPEHKAIIMDPRYVDTGLGMAVGMYQGQETLFVAEEFGVPKAFTPVQKIQPTISAVTSAVVKAPTKTATNPISKAVEVKAVATTTSSITVESIAASAPPSAPAEPPVQPSWFARLRAFIKGLFA